MGRSVIRAYHGRLVWAQDAFGKRLTRRAISDVVEGGDFDVVWVCKEDEWAAALKEERDPVGVPWPAEDVEITK